MGSRVGGAVRVSGGFSPARSEDEAGPPRSGGSRRPLCGDFPVSILPGGGCRSRRKGSLPRYIAAVFGGECWERGPESEMATGCATSLPWRLEAAPMKLAKPASGPAGRR
jgi:hypothetical protein